MDGANACREVGLPKHERGSNAIRCDRKRIREHNNAIVAGIANEQRRRRRIEEHALREVQSGRRANKRSARCEVRLPKHEIDVPAAGFQRRILKPFSFLGFEMDGG